MELAESRSRIHQLEESLLGKQTALDLLQNELTQMRATVNNNTDNEGTTTSENINKNQEPSVRDNLIYKFSLKKAKKYLARMGLEPETSVIPNPVHTVPTELSRP